MLVLSLADIYHYVCVCLTAKILRRHTLRAIVWKCVFLPSHELHFAISDILLSFLCILRLVRFALSLSHTFFLACTQCSVSSIKAYGINYTTESPTCTIRRHFKVVTHFVYKSISMCTTYYKYKHNILNVDQSVVHCRISLILGVEFIFMLRF